MNKMVLDINLTSASYLIEDGIQDYLPKQEGIISLDISNWEDKKRFTIEYDFNKTNPQIIFKYIIIFNKDKGLLLEGFNKDVNKNVSTCNYVVADMCCEYCYRGFVEDLFKNENIITVSSGFEEPFAENVEFEIGYTSCTEEELLSDIAKLYPNEKKED